MISEKEACNFLNLFSSRIRKKGIKNYLKWHYLWKCNSVIELGLFGSWFRPLLHEVLEDVVALYGGSVLEEENTFQWEQGSFPFHFVFNVSHLSTAWLFLLVLYPHLDYAALVSFNTLPGIFLPELEPLPPLCSILMLYLSSPFPLVFLVQNEPSFLLITAWKVPIQNVFPLPPQLFQPLSPLHDGLWHLCSLPSASFSSSVCLPSVLLGCFSPACW